MKLKEYCDTHGINKTVFAKLVGVNPKMIFDIVNDNANPSVCAAYRIEKLTNGRVTCQDLVSKKYLKQLEMRSEELKTKEKVC